MPSLTRDPRWIEYRDAYEAVKEGLRAPAGANERYRNAQFPYCQLLAEHCENATVRKEMMRALFEGGLSFGLIVGAFKATTEEADYVKDHPPYVALHVDEIERLQALPYPAYLRTQHWKRIRVEALKRSENQCALCRRTDMLDVHHRDYKRRGCERPVDVIVLCRGCHERHHAHLKAVS